MMGVAKRYIRDAITGEWLLWQRPNGGGVVAIRSLQVGVTLFLVAIAIESWLSPGSTLTFSGTAFKAAALHRLDWLGALTGATYAALYSRFASQWTYLAGLYNQLMAAENVEPRSELVGVKREKRITWWMAFIEDALDMHLADKPAYANVIGVLLAEPEISEACDSDGVGSPARLDGLKKRLTRALGAKHLKSISTPPETVTQAISDGETDGQQSA